MTRYKHLREEKHMEILAVDAEWELRQLVYKEVSTLKRQHSCMVVQTRVCPPSDSMIALVLFVCLSLGCLAQKPQRCSKYNNSDAESICVFMFLRSDPPLVSALHLLLTLTVQFCFCFRICGEMLCCKLDKCAVSNKTIKNTLIHSNSIPHTADWKLLCGKFGHLH